MRNYMSLRFEHDFDIIDRHIDQLVGSSEIPDTGSELWINVSNVKVVLDPCVAGRLHTAVLSHTIFSTSHGIPSTRDISELFGFY